MRKAVGGLGEGGDARSIRDLTKKQHMQWLEIAISNTHHPVTIAMFYDVFGGNHPHTYTFFSLSYLFIYTVRLRHRRAGLILSYLGNIAQKISVAGPGCPAKTSSCCCMCMEGLRGKAKAGRGISKTSSHGKYQCQPSQGRVMSKFGNGNYKRIKSHNMRNEGWDLLTRANGSRWRRKTGVRLSQDRMRARY